MTDLKFKLLSIIYNSEYGVDQAVLLNGLPDEYLKTSNALEDLQDQGLITCGDHIHYIITQSGRIVFEALQENRIKEAKNKREQDIRYWVTTGIAITALIISILALLLK